jgi:methylated-DNA-[protein]-cysteine S-methyltransferase
MSCTGLHVFDTALVSCGIAWSEQGLLAVQLPEGNQSATVRRLRRRFPAGEMRQPDAAGTRAMAAIIAALAGARADLDGIVLDLQEVPEFAQQVYRIARAIPRGETLTYGDIARQLGDLALSRAVGQALGANPFPIVVPCHRVLAASGMGGFSAHGGAATKRRLLLLEDTPGLQFSMFDDDGGH